MTYHITVNGLDYEVWINYGLDRYGDVCEFTIWEVLRDGQPVDGPELIDVFSACDDEHDKIAQACEDHQTHLASEVVYE